MSDLISREAFCCWIPMKDQYKNKQSNCDKNKLPEPYKGGIVND